MVSKYLPYKTGGPNENMENFPTHCTFIGDCIRWSFLLYKWIQSKQRAGKEIVQVQAEASPVIVAAGDLAWSPTKPEMLKNNPLFKGKPSRRSFYQTP